MSTPTDLFIEIKTGDVYWSDNTRDRIEKCDWNGKNRVVIKSSNLPNPKSIFVIDSMLFYVDSRLRSVNSMNSTMANSSLQIKQVSSRDLQEIIIFNDKVQPMDINSPCVGQNVCDQLCFPLPQQNTPKCACARGELDVNGRNCKVPREYLIFAMESEIRSVSLQAGGGVPWRAITGINKAVGIDFDYRDNKVIFSEIFFPLQ